jgi:hypothetical protein
MDEPRNPGSLSGTRLAKREVRKTTGGHDFRHHVYRGEEPKLNSAHHGVPGSARAATVSWTPKKCDWASSSPEENWKGELDKKHTRKKKEKGKEGKVTLKEWEGDRRQENGKD